MTDNHSAKPEISAEERDADSKVDMWSCIAVLAIVWVATVFWVSGL